MKATAHWKRVGIKPHHGICLPLSALRTEKSSGIGEFLDLLPLIEWCREVGFDCLQLLPLNDTGKDPSPYNPLSSCALDPIYLSLWDLQNRASLEQFKPYNHLSRLDRNGVKQLKLKWLHEYFQKTFPLISAAESYQKFLAENLWLDAYCHFMALKEICEWKHWQDWPSHLQGDPSTVDFYCFLQYLCFSQLKKVERFASEQSLFLIGDLPHLLSPDSADVWNHRSLFHLNLSAGAPPDQYNVLGQNWGFPLFNWEAMQEEGYAWWKERLSVMAHLYHIYRIDHIVGFFRIWATPRNNNTSEGFFVPADRSLWLAHGEKILEMILQTCPLLPIAEDLGTIPPEVPPLLKNLGICSTKVLRWQGTIPYNQYEPLSMTTLSTPDMEPVPLWWQNNPHEANRLAQLKGWQYQRTLSSDTQAEILRDAHHTSSCFHINLLQEYLFLFPDLRAHHLEDERINIPGSLFPTNWTFRFRPSVEEIIDHHSLVKKIQDILT